MSYHLVRFYLNMILNIAKVVLCNHFFSTQNPYSWDVQKI